MRASNKLCILLYSFFYLLNIYCLLSATSSFAQSIAPAQEVRKILASQIDFAGSKLTFDRIINPTIDSTEVHHKLDDLTAQARAMLGPNPTDFDKINAVRRVLYKAGPWNGNRPFIYNHADPFGHDIRNKLLASYLQTRLGNCVSMPTLFLIIADRLGLNISLALAPLHVFIRYTDPQGRALNIETTDYGNPVHLSFYREKLSISDHAVESGLYLRTLTRQEVVAEMATTVMDWELGRQHYQEAVAIGNAILERFPLDGYTMVKRGTAYGALLKAECAGNPAAMSPASKTRCDTLAAHNTEDFQHAEALGWAPSE